MTVEKLRSYEPLFGLWTVEGKIAEGRHSKVFRVSRVQDGEMCYQCLKAVRFPADDEELSRVISSGLYQNVQEYLDEVELSVKSNMEKMLTLKADKNVVRFDDYTIIKESSCFYLLILTELLSPMNEHIKAETATQNDIIELGCDICSALDAFRTQGIIHREVKPENIYVDADGNYKLGDFGVCRSRFGEDKIISSYIAPELYANDSESVNSDIYSLGILLYKLLNNNRLPFLPSYPAPVSIDDRETAFTRRMRGDLFPAPSNATTQLAHVIYKAAAFKSAERFAEPYDFAVELRNQYIVPQREEPIDIYSHSRPEVPVNPYHITDETDIPLYEQSPVQHSEVTQQDREFFNEAFTDDEDDEEQEGEKVNKLWYLVIVALVIVLAFVIGFIAKNSIDEKKNATTTAMAPNTTFGQQTSEFITTTQPTTTATTTTQTTTATTTTETTTTTTTTATTTTETTTETTTSATTTTETTTTQPSTTETTTETTTAEPEYMDPILVYSPNTEEDEDEMGRSYKSVELTVEQGFGTGKEAVIVIRGLDGVNAATDDSCVTVCTMDGTRMERRSLTAIFVETETEDFIRCRIVADDDSFRFEPEKYQYFICFEDGAVATESSVNLGTQIRLED